MSTPHPENAKRLKRRDSLRLMFAPATLRGSLSLALDQPLMRVSVLIGLQIGLSVIIAISIMVSLGHEDLMGFGALGALVALFGRFAPKGGRAPVLFFSAITQTAGVLIMSLAMAADLPEPVVHLVLTLLCGSFFFLTISRSFGPPGALIFIFAAGAAMSPMADGTALLERVAATGSMAVLTILICLLTDRFRFPRDRELALPVEPSRPLKTRMIASLRMTLGAGLGIFGAAAVGLGHEAWAGMGVVAVLQGAHLHITMHRALQRMAGTVIGAVIAWLILYQDPSLLSVVAIVVCMNIAIEIVIGINYGLGQILITPMALLMTSLAPNAGALDLVPQRVLDTLLGVAVGTLIAIVFSSLDDRRRLAEHGAG